MTTLHPLITPTPAPLRSSLTRGSAVLAVRGFQDYFSRNAPALIHKKPTAPPRAFFSGRSSVTVSPAHLPFFDCLSQGAWHDKANADGLAASGG